MSVCAVQGCKHNTKNSTCRKFRYPSFPFRRNIWCQLTRVSASSLRGWDRVCSCHFGDEDPLPSIFPWTTKNYTEIEANVLTKTPHRGKREEQKLLSALVASAPEEVRSLVGESPRFAALPGPKGRKVYRAVNLENLADTRLVVTTTADGKLTLNSVTATTEAGDAGDDQSENVNPNANAVDAEPTDEADEQQTEPAAPRAVAGRASKTQDGSKSDPLYEALLQLGIDPIEEEHAGEGEEPGHEDEGETRGPVREERGLATITIPVKKEKTSHVSRSTRGDPELHRPRSRQLLALLQLKRDNQQKASMLSLRTRLLRTALDDYREAYNAFHHKRDRKSAGMQFDGDEGGWIKAEPGAGGDVMMESVAVADLLRTAAAAGGTEEGSRPPDVEYASRGQPLTLLRPDPNTPHWEQQVEGDLVTLPTDLPAALELIQLLRQRVLLLRGRVLERAGAETSLRCQLAEAETRALRTEVHYRDRLDTVFSRQQQSRLLGSQKPLLWSERDLLSAIDLRSLASRRAFEYVREVLRIPLPSMAVVRTVAAANKYPEVTRRFNELRASRGLGASQTSAAAYASESYQFAPADDEEAATAASMIAAPYYHSPTQSVSDRSDTFYIEDDATYDRQTQAPADSYPSGDVADTLIYRIEGQEDEPTEVPTYHEGEYVEVEVGGTQVYPEEGYAEVEIADTQTYQVESDAEAGAQVHPVTQEYAEAAGPVYNLEKIELQPDDADQAAGESEEEDEYRATVQKRKASGDDQPSDESGADESQDTPAAAGARNWPAKRPRYASEGSTSAAESAAAAKTPGRGRGRKRGSPPRWRTMSTTEEGASGDTSGTRSSRRRGRPARGRSPQSAGRRGRGRGRMSVSRSGESW